MIDVFGVLDHFGGLFFDLEHGAVAVPAAEGGLGEFFVEFFAAKLDDLGLGEFVFVEPLGDLIALFICELGEGRAGAGTAGGGAVLLPVGGFAVGFGFS